MCSGVLCKSHKKLQRHLGEGRRERNGRVDGFFVWCVTVDSPRARERESTGHFSLALYVLKSIKSIFVNLLTDKVQLDCCYSVLSEQRKAILKRESLIHFSTLVSI